MSLRAISNTTMSATADIHFLSYMFQMFGPSTSLVLTPLLDMIGNQPWKWLALKKMVSVGLASANSNLAVAIVFDRTYPNQTSVSPTWINV